MTDPEPPKTSNRGRFQPGHKLATGRPKNSPNKNLREHAITGLTRGGAAKAKKAGKNGQTNGLTYFFEDLAEKNPVAAASLASKLISSEPEQKTNASDDIAHINVVSVIAGNQFAPGKCGVLLPYDQCEEAWKAYHAGDEVWRAYVLTLEPILTKAAFEALSLVEAPIKSDVDEDVQVTNVTPLRLAAPAPMPQSSEEDEARTIANLKAQINELADKLGIDVVV
jgi:hypothetical protein